MHLINSALSIFLPLLLLTTSAGVSAQETRPPAPLPKPSKFGVLLFPGFEIMDIGGPLSALNLLTESQTTPSNRMSLTTLSAHPGPVSTNTSWNFYETFIAEASIHSPAAFDIDFLLVPGGPGTRTLPSEYHEYIAKVYPKLKYMVIVCTGVGVAAKSGILDGRRATSNKAAWQWVIAQGPKVKWVREARWVVDGNIWTTSGISAGTDGTLDWIATVYGNETVTRVGNIMEYQRWLNASYDPFSDIWNSTKRSPDPDPPWSHFTTSLFSTLLFLPIELLITVVLVLSAFFMLTSLLGQPIFPFIPGLPPPYQPPISSTSLIPVSTAAGPVVIATAVPDAVMYGDDREGRGSESYDGYWVRNDVSGKWEYRGTFEEKGSDREGYHYPPWISGSGDYRHRSERQEYRGQYWGRDYSSEGASASSSAPYHREKDRGRGGDGDRDIDRHRERSYSRDRRGPRHRDSSHRSQERARRRERERERDLQGEYADFGDGGESIVAAAGGVLVRMSSSGSRRRRESREREKDKKWDKERSDTRERKGGGIKHLSTQFM